MAGGVWWSECSAIGGYRDWCLNMNIYDLMEWDMGGRYPGLSF